MTDIIKGAKNLLEGATPAPWKVYAWERHPGSDVYVAGHDLAPVTGDGWIKPADGALIAAAPELAQALAEETYEYGVEYKYLTNRGAEWRLDPDVGWHKTYRDAERAASASVQFRIVRRRVSPPEVINE